MVRRSEQVRENKTMSDEKKVKAELNIRIYEDENGINQAVNAHGFNDFMIVGFLENLKLAALKRISEQPNSEVSQNGK